MENREGTAERGTRRGNTAGCTHTAAAVGGPLTGSEAAEVSIAVAVVGRCDSPPRPALLAEGSSSV